MDMERIGLSTDELDQIKLERMTALEDTERVAVDLDSGVYEALQTPAEILKEAIHVFNTGGFDEIEKKPQYEVDGIEAPEVNEDFIPQPM